MIKKISLFVVTLLLSVSLFACTESDYSFGTYEYMDTYIEIKMTTTSKNFDVYKEEIQNIYDMYDQLTNNFVGLSDSSEYLENIYTINQKVGQKLEIDEPLYLILQKSEEIKTLTDGYFDVSIGKAIDVWKALITAEYTDNTMTEAVYNQAILDIDALDFSTNVMTLTEEDGHYYIETSGDDFKLDLGAISKGYATDQVKQYLESEGVEYYYISAGSSSLYLAKNSNPDRDYFNIGLTCPVCTSSGTYGTIQNVIDESVTTSGDYEQYVLYNDLRYHHIISPITKMPMQYNHTVTIVGEDAGLLDALSTALFSMPDEEFTAWVDAHQTDMNLSIIRYRYDGTITQSLLGDLTFEEA